MEAEEKTPELTKEMIDELNKDFEKSDPMVVAEKLTSLTGVAGGTAKETVAALLTEAINKGVMPKHALKLGDDTMEAIYGQAYNLYNQGRYKEASFIFRLLMLLDYLTPKYILGLAACLHRQKDYKNAANIYLMCGTLDTKNPLPHYHAADCYMQLNLPGMALFSLGLAIKSAGEQPQYSVIKERSTLMKEALQKQFKEDVEKAKKEEGESEEEEE